MNVDLASIRATNYINRMMTAAVKAGDLGAARHLLQSLESLKAATNTLQINGSGQEP